MTRFPSDADSDNTENIDITYGSNDMTPTEENILFELTSAAKDIKYFEETLISISSFPEDEQGDKAAKKGKSSHLE